MLQVRIQPRFESHMQRQTRVTCILGFEVCIVFIAAIHPGVVAPLDTSEERRALGACSAQ